MAKVLTAAAVARMTHSSVTRARSASRRAKGLVATRGGVEEVGDGQATGLYLQLYPSGRKAWALRYRRPFDDRPAKLVLGPVISDAEIDAKPLIGAPLSLAAAGRLAGA